MPTEPGRLPRDMAALVLGAFGGPDALEYRTVPRPEPKGREVLIRVAYCGVCRHDLLTRAGAFPGIDLPVILGHQVSGTVAARGPDATAHAVGDRVMTLIYTGCGDCAECRAGNAALCRVERPRFLGEDMDGGYADYVAVREDTVVAVPDAVPLADASILTCTYGTAYHAIVTRGAIEAGETVVVTGASGGVGLHALRVLAWRGARTLAVTSSAGKAAELEAAGAEVIVAPDRRFARAVKERTGGRGADAVLEIVGGPTLGESIHAVRSGGRVVLVGNVEGGTAEIRPAHFILKEISLIGTKSCRADEVRAVLDLMAQGVLPVRIGAVYDLPQGAEVHRAMERGEGVGRLAVRVAGEGDAPGG